MVTLILYITSPLLVILSLSLGVTNRSLFVLPLKNGLTLYWTELRWCVHGCIYAEMTGLQLSVPASAEHWLDACWYYKWVLTLSCKGRAVCVVLFDHVHREHETTKSVYVHHFNPMKSIMWPEHSYTYISHYWQMFLNKYTSHIISICPTGIPL